MERKEAPRASARAPRVAGLAAHRVALALLLAGLALATLGLGLRPGAWAGEDFVVLRGPALARYDAANDTTLVVPYCGHWRCDAGYHVAGDARDATDALRFGLRGAGDDADGLVPIEPPLAHPESPVPVTQARQGPYEPSPVWPRAGALLGGLVLAGAGAAWLAGARAAKGARPGAPWMAAALLPIPGAAAGAWGASMGDGGLLVLFAAFPLALVGTLLLLSRRTQPFGVGLLVGALVALAALLLAQPYFPSEPAL